MSKRRINECGALLRDLPAGIAEAIAVVDAWRRAHAGPMERVATDLRSSFDAPRVSERLKRFDTILHKLRRHPRMNLTQMEDIAGVRATLADQEQVLQVAAALERSRTLRRRRAYVDGGDPGPKADGYRAVHLVVVEDGQFVEIQLRTARQDAWAQAIERDGDRLGAGLKFGDGPEDLRAFHRMSAEHDAMLDAGVAPPPGFEAQLAELYAATRRYFTRRAR